MGVISNKVNIMELMRSGGGGDPTIPGRVSALELETTGLAEADVRIMSSVRSLAETTAYIQTSVSDCVEALQRVQTSVASISEDLYDPTYESAEHVIGTWIDGKTIYEQYIRLENISTSDAGGVQMYESPLAYLPRSVYDTLISVNITVQRNGYYSFSDSMPQGSSGYHTAVLANNGKIELYSSFALSNVDITVHLIYTKVA